jgi:hypothetical protein
MVLLKIDGAGMAEIGPALKPWPRMESNQTRPAAEFVQLFAACEPGKLRLALGARERQRAVIAPAAGERVAFEIVAHGGGPMCQRPADPYRRSGHQVPHFGSPLGGRERNLVAAQLRDMALSLEARPGRAAIGCAGAHPD